MSKTLTRLFGALALTATMAFTAHALVFPPGTINGTSPGPFPDTLTVANVQNPASVPFPAVLDTVLGIPGIITGFDLRPSGFAFYIQNSGGAPWTGIDIFTGSFNFNASPFNLAIGDSVVTYGRKQEFPAGLNGGSELEGLDGVQGTQDLAYRKISSGNALPPFFVGNVQNLNLLQTNTFGEQYEGMLVRINGPLRVARVVGTGTNFFIAVDGSVPPANAVDSVLIDGNTLPSTAVSPPALGATVLSVQGIYEQRTTYRIQLRNGNDIALNAPPNLADAYPLSNTTLRVLFDRDVTATSATTTGNYSLGSFGAVTGAVMDGNSTVILTIANGLLPGADESVTSVNIVGLASGLPSASQTSNFYNGVLSPQDVQLASPDSLASATCNDRSRFAGLGGQTTQGGVGRRASLRASITGVFTPLSYGAQNVAGLRNGVSFFAPLQPLVVNRDYLYVGAVQEFFGESEMVSNVYIQDYGAVSPIAPIVASITNVDTDVCDVTSSTTDGEDYEGMLVTLPYVRKVRAIFADGTGNLPSTGFHVDGPSGAITDTIFISNLNGVLGTNDSTNVNFQVLGHTLSVTGLVHYTGTFRICPRNAADIIDHGLNVGVPPTPLKLTFSVYPNPSSRANLAFTLPQETDIELSVFDVAGREVASLAKGRYPAGSYTKAWAGRDSKGSQLGAGVYFTRLKAGDELRTVRTVLIGQ